MNRLFNQNFQILGKQAAFLAGQGFALLYMKTQYINAGTCTCAGVRLCVNSVPLTARAFGSFRSEHKIWISRLRLGPGGLFRLVRVHQHLPQRPGHGYLQLVHGRLIFAPPRPAMFSKQSRAKDHVVVKATTLFHTRVWRRCSGRT